MTTTKQHSPMGTCSKCGAAVNPFKSHVCVIAPTPHSLERDYMAEVLADAQAGDVPTVPTIQRAIANRDRLAAENAQQAKQIERLLKAARKAARLLNGVSMPASRTQEAEFTLRDALAAAFAASDAAVKARAALAKETP